MDTSFQATQNVHQLRELLSREVRPERRDDLIALLAAELAKLPEPSQRIELIRTARYLIT
jgi:hypothetical protein